GAAEGGAVDDAGPAVLPVQGPEHEALEAAGVVDGDLPANRRGRGRDRHSCNRAIQHGCPSLVSMRWTSGRTAGVFRYTAPLRGFQESSRIDARCRATAQYSPGNGVCTACAA